MLAAKLLPLVKKSKGSIINMSSVGKEHPAPNISLYVAAKAAVENHLTKSRANELAGEGVRVNAIAPGAIETSI
ncbi:SDR family oxidoreductase [Allobaculum mucilyticum]|nr:SDR family oxidoreductase [Allobaculum mucilyticum]